MVDKVERLLSRFRIPDGKRFRLADHDPASTGGLEDSAGHKEALENSVKRLAKLQNKLYAQDQWAVLLIFQAMDAAGKDGAIKHVMSGVNPQGCQVYSFKAPSPEELDHDYLWRTSKNLPERGRIGIFNRSYYEEVLAVRVHASLLARQKLPKSHITKDIWRQRFDDISHFERYLFHNGILVRKFFLHVSRKEQKKRFLDRLDDPDSNWKFSSADARERGYWTQYMKAYEDMIRHTASVHAPWFVVPADNKWFTRLVVATAVREALESLHVHYPVVGKAQKRDLATARRLIARQK